MGFNEISAPTVQVMAPGQIDPWKPGKIRYGEAIEQANTILPHAHAGCKVCFCGPCNYPSCCSCWVQRSLQIPCPIFLCVLPRFNPDGLCIIPTLCGVPIPICCGSHTRKNGSFMSCNMGEGGEKRLVLLDEEAQIINVYDAGGGHRSAECSLVPITKLLKVGC